jgi:hypothetical protein
MFYTAKLQRCLFYFLILCFFFACKEKEACDTPIKTPIYPDIHVNKASLNPQTNYTYILIE